MRIRKWSLTIIIGLCLTLFPSSLFAAVSVTPVTSAVHPGSQITVTGTSDLSEVIIKVYRPDHSLLYFNVAKVVDGAYSDTITLGASEVIGTYEIKVGQGSQISSTTVTVSERDPLIVAMPTANPSGGAVATGTKVTLSSLTSGAKVYYTIDGSDPTASSLLYSAPITISSALTIKAIATHEGMTTSRIMSVSYTIASTSNVGPGNSPAPTNDKVISTDGALTLPVGKPGEVSLGDGILISIPANATQQELKLTIKKLLGTEYVVTDKQVLTSSVYEVLKNFTENFKNPITLTFAFDPTSVKGNQKASVFYFDEVKKVWVEVGGKVNGSKISVEVDHFTKYAVFAVDTKLEAQFRDITGHWAEAKIKKAVSDGIVSGYTDGTFKPNATVTRAEFAVMLMNALKPQGEGVALTFADAAKIKPWAQKAIAQAVQGGIIKGFADNTFGPDALITRAEMASMIAKALGKSDEAIAATDFADDKDIPAWAKGSIAFVKQAGIVQGKGNNRFAPQDSATRAEAVSVLLKMLEQPMK